MTGSDQQKLTVNEFKEIREKIFAIINYSSDKISALLGEGKISEQESDYLYGKQIELREQLNNLELKFVTDILTDIKQAGNEIEKATDKLQQTLDSLNNYNRFLQVVSLGIDLVSNFFVAFQSTPPAVANVLSVVEQIQKL